MKYLNTIQQGDCLDLIKDLPDASIDCIITDPPYFLGVTHNGQKGTYSDLAIMKPFFAGLFFQMERVLRKDGHLYLFCDWRTYPFFYPVAEQYIPIKNLLVWYKGMSGGNQYGFLTSLPCSVPREMLTLAAKTSSRTCPDFQRAPKRQMEKNCIRHRKRLRLSSF
jgi:hypothetical protein